MNREAGKPKYCGDFEDGFGNKMTVHAVSNPTFSNKKPANLYDRATGYGIVRFNKKSRDITVECWPRGVDPSNKEAQQYFGWPIVINQLDNYYTKDALWLPEIIINETDNPVIQVIDERTKEIVYTIRIKGNQFQPRVFNEGSYTIKIGQPDEDLLQILSGIKTINDPKEKVISVNIYNQN